MRGDTTSGDPPLLVAGAPRTGTTWIAQVLASAGDVAWVNEPDNEWPNVFALKAKLRLGRFPALAEVDRAPAYEELWRRSLLGLREGRYQTTLAWKLDQKDRTMQELWRCMCDHANPRLSPRLRLLSVVARPPSQQADGRHVMVKSVHAPLALEWIWTRFRPTTVVVLRHPLNVIASWLELGWGGCALDTNPRVWDRFGDRWRLPRLDPDPSQTQRLSWEAGLFTTALREGADRHPEWIAASHEDLCADPVTMFKDLFEQVAYAWSPQVEAFLGESNQPGEGWSTHRIAAEQPGRWRHRLTDAQLDEIWSVLSRFEAPWVQAVAADLR